MTASVTPGMTDTTSGPVVLRAPAKLTRTLRVTGVRADGMHLLDAEMVSLDLHDELHLTTGDGITVDGPGGIPTDTTNLVSRALAAVGRQAAVRLMKRIPAGAGLGGGSSDAAAVLRWAGVRPDRAGLELAVSLGADVPFCLMGGRARVGGVGQEVEPLPFLDLAFALLLLPFGVATGAVYARWDELGRPVGGEGNDLEPAAMAVEPRLAGWRDALGDETGATPRLAGSGSTWFVEGDWPGLPDRITGRDGQTARVIRARAVPG